MNKKNLDFIQLVADELFPGFTGKLIEERVIMFAITYDDTADFIPLLEKDFQRILEGEMVKWPNWMEFAGLSNETQYASCNYIIENKEIPSEAILIWAIQLIYYIEDPEQSQYSGQDGILAYLIGFMLHKKNKKLRNASFQKSIELLQVVPSPSFFECCVFHECLADGNTMVSVSDEILRMRYGSEKNAAQFREHVFFSIECFEFDYWWRHINVTGELSECRQSIESKIELFKANCKKAGLHG